MRNNRTSARVQGYDLVSAPPYMPLYVADYLSDTTGLTTEQHGAYLLLLMAMWRAGGSLPNEGAKLARFARLTPAKWARLEADVMSLFTASDDGCITHKRLAAEFEKAAEKSSKRAAAGALGGKATSLKNKGSSAAKSQRLPKHSIESESDSESKGEDSPPNPLLPISTVKPFDAFWEAYPNKVGKRDAEKKFGKALERIGGADPAAVILLGLTRAKASRKWAEGFIPNPATWLHQDRWNDQPEEFNGTPNSRPDRLQQRIATVFEPMAAGAQEALDRRRRRSFFGEIDLG